MSQPPMLQLDLFAAPALDSASPTEMSARPSASQGCSGCGRSEEEAPVHVINDRGRFCLDCQPQAFAWLEPERPYIAGGRDHARPWSNPALTSGQVRPSGARTRGRRPA